MTTSLPRIFPAMLAALVLVPVGFLPVSAGAAASADFAAGRSGKVETPDLMAVGRAVALRLEGDGPLTVAGFVLDREQLRQFYEHRNFAPAWIDHGERVAELDAVLARAGEDGIESGLPKSVGQSPDPAEPAERELLLTGAALRYGTALAVGRVRPNTLEEDWAVPAPAFDPVAGLERSLRGKAGALTRWLASLAPADPRYLGLKGALARYRELAAAGGWERIPVGAGFPVKPGTSDERIPLIRQRLTVEGDLAAPSPDIPPNLDPLLDPELEKGVRAFQRRHGISEDGAIGPRTLAALNLPVKSRIEQIMLNLERWRSLPRHLGRDYIFVNVPAETLEVFENGKAVMAMKAVVGDTGHPTPVVQASLAGLTFNPVWNVPSSIAVKEILPKTRKDAGYLDRNHIRAYGTNSFVQQAGPLNPLGQIKFDTPNRFDVYLHDTPSRRSFERAARAMSHGCVRLERARDLAAYVLDSGLWKGDSIDRAIATGETQKISIARHLRVHIFYFTSFVDPDGTVEFRDDIYGRDKRLAAALDAVSDAHLLAEPQAPKDAPKGKGRVS